MLKVYLFSAALSLPFLVSSQQVVDFESFQFPSGQDYWTGTQENGGFTLNGATFSNSNFTFYWFGFAVSSLTDTVTPGWANEMSVFAGSGANGSEKFAIYYPIGDITFESPVAPVSMAVTNTTYAALSMRHGDSFGKKFGSIYGANGLEDGTNGKDWFKLTVIGFNAQGDVTGEIDFYLADFRSDDSTEHYILNTWETIDLSPLGLVKKITFELNSSDTSGGYMNTPAYFALDDLTFFQFVAGVNEFSEPSYSLHPNPAKDFVNIVNNAHEAFSIVISDAGGSTLFQRDSSYEHLLDLSMLPNGVYFVKMISNKAISTERIVVAR
jgi:hypothetical protein